jgi:predicted CDP-diglyceride synthetase/phosphatidate cytidylyltransferase
MIPALVVAGHHTTHIERDLSIEDQRPSPGHGQILSNLKTVFYTGPVVFHYLRYFVQ